MLTKRILKLPCRVPSRTINHVPSGKEGRKDVVFAIVYDLSTMLLANLRGVSCGLVTLCHPCRSEKEYQTMLIKGCTLKGEEWTLREL
jgi:hypothetical protein